MKTFLTNIGHLLINTGFWIMLLALWLGASYGIIRVLDLLGY